VLLTVLLAGLLVVLLAELLAYSRDIKTFEVLKWRWKKGLIFGLPVVLPVGLFFGLAAAVAAAVDDGLFGGLIFGLPVVLIFVLIFGLRSEELQTKTVPNQGIRQSAKNAVILGLLVVLIFGLLGGLFVGLFFGGFAFIEHYCLRVIIYRSGYIPWNYARFLNYAAERIFLRKVGGGYIFVHRLLMDYFASLEQEQEGG